MKSISERPPILTVHEDQGDYILRVGDTRYRGLVVGVSKLLIDARRLIVVTPSDVKFFTVNGSGDGETISDRNDLPSSDLHGSDRSGAGHDDMVQDENSLPQSGPLPSGAEVVGETPQGTKVVRRKKQDTVAGRMENCQRCGGTGKARVMMPDGQPAESACPICKGEGTIRRYGARR